MYQRTLLGASKLIEIYRSRGATAKEIAQVVCISTRVPIAVCVAWMMREDMFGPLPELQESLDNLIKFYNYKEIIPFDI